MVVAMQVRHETIDVMPARAQRSIDHPPLVRWFTCPLPFLRGQETAKLLTPASGAPPTLALGCAEQ